MKSFNDILKNAKTMLNMNRMEFASLLGHPIDSVTKWYQGRATPNEERQEKILAIIKKALN